MTNELPDRSTSSCPTLSQQTWWRKPLIWGVFLTLIYLLREFFLIGFLTFLCCFIVRSLVGIIAHRIAKGRESRRLDLLLTLLIFTCVCLAFYGLGRFFVPPVIRQGKSLATQLRHLHAVDVQNTLLANTVGDWEFKQRFGTPEDPRYKKGLAEFQAANRDGEGLYQTFPILQSRLESEFEASYEQAQVLYLQSHGAQGSGTSGPFEEWFLKVKAPELLRDKSEYYVGRWETEHASPEKAGELAALQKQPDFEAQRDQQIRDRIWADFQADPVLLAQLRAQWNHADSIEAWDKLRRSPEYQARFKTFYETQAKGASSRVPIDYSFYHTLVAAYPQGKQAFLDAVRHHDDQESGSPAHEQFDFESVTKLELGQQWWGTSHAADWVRDRSREDGPKILDVVIAWFDKTLSHLVRVPLHIGTALLLSIFMLLEWHGVTRGMADLRNTRLRPIYDEIAPGVIALGKLMGKSFEGQAIISLINACLTLLFLWLIGVEYKFILALCVFVFSFIPVVGVILSGGPMCAIALLQPGGSLWMAFQVVVAVAIIHLIEGMILSPRIIGKIGHLNPILVIAILLVAEKFFGMWGLVLGVPVAIYIIRVVILNSPIPGIYQPREQPEPS